MVPYGAICGQWKQKWAMGHFSRISVFSEYCMKYWHLKMSLPLWERKNPHIQYNGWLSVHSQDVQSGLNFNFSEDHCEIVILYHFLCMV